MRETLTRRAQWNGWRGKIENVPGECRRAVELTCSSTRLDYRELATFKQNLLEIALGVAMAYQEYDEDGAPARQS